MDDVEKAGLSGAIGNSGKNHFSNTCQQRQQHNLSSACSTPLKQCASAAGEHLALDDERSQQHHHHSNCNADNDDNNDNQKTNCLSRLLKIVFSTPGLVLLVIAYSIMGALIFPLLEAPQDISKSTAIAKSREDCLRELWTITGKRSLLI